MRFNVVGSDPETGQHLEMVDAPSVEAAASIARRRQVHVMSVTPAEVHHPPAPSRARQRSFRTDTAPAPERPGRGLRATTTVLLVSALFIAISYPLATLAVGGALLAAVGTFVVVPRARDALRRVLGVWPDRPARGAVKLAALVLFGAFLVTFALDGRESVERERARQAQQRAQDAAAAERAKQLAVEVRGLLGEASTALQAGDLAKGEELARKAAAIKTAPNREEAVELVGKIEFATVPARALNLLAKMPESEFAAFAEHGEATASMVLGYDVLNARLQENARGQLAAATSQREKLAAEERARAEEARKQAEARSEQERKRQASARAAAEAKAKGNPTGKTVHVGYTSYCVWRSWWSATVSNEPLSGRLREIQLDRLKEAPTAYLFVDLTVRNDDKKARTIPPLKLIDENGAEYETDSEATFVEGTFGPLDSLNPGVSKQGLLVFHAPRSHTYRLQVDGGFWSSESALMKLEPTEGR